MNSKQPSSATWTINKWLAFFIVALGMFIATLDSGVVNVAIPTLVNYFHTTTSTILWVTLIYFIAGVGLMPTMGWIGDKKGRRRVYMLGFLVFTVGLTLSTIPQNIYQMILFRFIQGIGNSMLMSNGLAIIAQSFPHNERGKAIGLNGAVLGLGLAGGPTLGGFLLDALNWQSIFYTRIPLAILGIALASIYLPKDSQKSGLVNLDYPGAAALFGSTGAFLFTLSEGSKYGFTSPAILTSAICTAALLVAFILREQRASNPVVEMALFKIRQFRTTLTLHVLHYLIVGSISFLMPFYLIDGLGYSAAKAGLFISIFFTLRLPFAPTSGWLADRLGFRVISLIGLSTAALGAFILSRLGSSGTQLTIGLSLLLAGLGSAMFEPTNSTGIMGALKHDQLGLASAAISVGRQIGLASGTAVGGTVFILRQASYTAALQSQGLSVEAIKSQATARGFQDALLFIVIIVVIGLFSPLIDRGKTTKAQSGDDTQKT